MADFNLEDLCTRVQSEIYQVAGPAVQVYSQDMIINRINDAYITFFDDTSITWKKFLTYATYTLNGTTGESTTSVAATFLDYDDILFIYPDGSDRPLNKWNLNRNPALITGDRPVMITPSDTATKIFKVLPATAVGDVVVLGKSRSAAWPFDDFADIVNFDYLAIVYYVAWQMMVDDGANPGAAEKLQKLFNNRYKELDQKQGRAPIALNGISSGIPTTWQDRV